jgi:wyosine [tRNA(Phe)-imidazoG37] synthetase (radical SAM superfamily)
MAQIDYLTLSGSGETTLYTGIGKLIDALKKEFHAPVAVLTNGSLLGDPDVAESLLKADVVLPTLAADDETVFQCVHRPHTGLHYEQVIKGMVRFSEQFENHLWLELFLLGGVTAMEKTIASMKEIIDAVNPEKIQLNTATRPPAEEFAFPVSGERLAVFAKMLGPRAEVVGDSNVKSAHVAEAGGDAEETVLSLLGRRPCTAIDAAEALSLPYIEVVKLLADLAVRGRVVSKRHSGKMFYQIG